MEFTDVVMKRRAVRRFEDGGVDREVIERIARLAQRTPTGSTVRRRVRVSPRMITAPPTTWAGRIGSERNSAPRITAPTGTRSWLTDALVGPM